MEELEQKQEQTLQEESSTPPAEKQPESPAPATDVPPQRQWQSQAEAMFTQKPAAPPAQPNTQRPVQPGYVPPAGQPVQPNMQRPVPPAYVPPAGQPVQPNMQRPVQPAYVPPAGQPVQPNMQRPVQPGYVPPAGQPVQPHMQQNWYQDNTPRYGGWQVPPQVPPASSKAPMTPEKKDKRTAFWLKIVAGLIVVLIVYCIGSDIVSYRRGAVATSGKPSASDTEHTNRGTGGEVIIQQQDKPELTPGENGVGADGTYTVEGVAAAVRPSIVEIYNYGDDSGELIAGTGSGIILSEDGYIITNAHVLTGGVSFTVMTSDEKEYDAQVVGSDAKTDLAVIKIEADNLQAAVMGDSDEVVLGEAVVAIGNPAGLSGSVTNGIVSGLNRQIRSDSTGFDMNCIQTNAAISPGNSGGALVNMYGQVIGITSSKYVSSSYEGLGFAITINDVLPIVEDLIANGYVSDRVRVGITFAPLNNVYVAEEFAEEIGMQDVPEDIAGVWITEIAEDCDVAKTDLQVNDVIIQVEGMDVSDYDTICEAIEGKAAGEKIKAVCRRYQANGTYETFTISFALMADTSGNY